jgi:hypothetical protein
MLVNLQVLTYSLVKLKRSIETKGLEAQVYNLDA